MAHDERQRFHSFHIVLLALVTASLALPARAQDVLTVPGNYGTLQAAVDAADPGAIILATPGVTQDTLVIDGKSLSVLSRGHPSAASATDADFVFVGEIVVRNLGPDQRVLLAGLKVGPPGSADGALRLEDNLGPVLVQECWVLGRNGSVGMLQGGHGIDITNCVAVTLSHVRVAAGFGLFSVSQPSFPGVGGDAVRCTASQVALYAGHLTGGRGANGGTEGFGALSGRAGGDAMSNADGFVFISGSLLLGGQGGSGDCDFFPSDCGSGGDGGNGLTQTGAGSHATRADSQLFGGSGGIAFGSGSPGSPGSPAAIGGGSLLVTVDPPPSLAVVSPVPQGDQAQVVVGGEPGALAGLLFGLDLGLAPLTPPTGVLQVPAPTVLILGTVPANGRIGLQVGVPLLGPGLEALPVSLQAAQSDTSGGATLGTHAALTLLGSFF